MNYYIQTLGCQMNKSDSERIATVVEDLGYIPVATQDKADLIIVNTCSIRQTAEDRVFGQARNWRDLKQQNPNLVVAVTGCLPGRDKDSSLREKLPVVDLFFPIKDLPQFPQWLAGLNATINNSGKLADDYLRIRPKNVGVKQAWLAISSGCNNYCTFCVVPYARGFERSRPVADIMSEAKSLVSKGYVEITLLGQNVNTFKPSDPENFLPNNPYKDYFAALLWEMNQLEGLQRLHFTSPNPQDMTDEVIDALTLPKQLNLLHLPVQSGSNRILKKMNRRVTREEYFKIIEKVKGVKQGIALATDIIVGFCGEDEADFMATVDLYRQVEFDVSYNAIYSSRSGTVAHKMWLDDVPLLEKRRRWLYLQQVMEEITYKKNQSYVGKTVSVLVEKQNKGYLYGNSSELKLVRFSGDKSQIGNIVPIKITEAQTWQLIGELIK